MVCAAMTYMLLPTGVFIMAGVSETKPLNRLIPLVAIQMIPELVVDLVLTMNELRNGMEVFYRWYIQRPCSEFWLSCMAHTFISLCIIFLVSSLCVDIS